MTTVLLAGVPKSPNLGDGLIARTLTHLIQMQGPHEVIHFDLTHGRFAGESSEDEACDRHPGSYRLNGDGLKKRATPDSLRMAKAYWIHRRNHSRINGQLREMVAQSDVVMIGGGHLFIDTYLTFPLAVRRVAAEAARQHKPLHIMLVGARGPWSPPARAWFRSVCRYAATIAVRDEESRNYMLSVDASLAGKMVALSDPALFTQEVLASSVKSSSTRSGAAYTIQRAAAGVHASSAVGVLEAPVHAAASAIGVLDPPAAAHSSRVIGLGIMDPNEMRRSTGLRWDRETCAEWWRSAAAALADRGYSVRVFTNGAETDNAFVEQMVKPRCGGIPNMSFYPYPSTVDGLINQIADCDAVVAQRLHACLPAISMRKPTYGIIWDKKLSSIFRDLDLDGHLVDFNMPAADAVAAMRLDDGPAAESLHTMLHKKDLLFKHIRSILP
ncbi:polysaccharide pyruvyl transferase family protein [Paenibacillus oenotherae]|uniref:Polysaccharide pyruvyl transferase family protein n=1 Tax=Paenibacillus oenotherae TaxID=1435645 RepID=A0ABS7D2W5_9BACL|nr:polysaccharide pyruvyl transferase family protein [Paenibacillus oenotherae]MBW7474269.1 polysaccharide pyruvyl transferase family protein [Paenibacillus oenotherae]